MEKVQMLWSNDKNRKWKKKKKKKRQMTSVPQLLSFPKAFLLIYPIQVSQE